MNVSVLMSASPGRRTACSSLLTMILAALSAAALTANPVSEEPMRALPASDIAAACLDRETLVSAEICYAFIIGVVQREWRLVGENKAAGFCLPENITHHDAVVAVRKYFRRNLNRSGDAADVFVLDALRAAYPCA